MPQTNASQLLASLEEPSPCPAAGDVELCLSKKEDHHIMDKWVDVKKIGDKSGKPDADFELKVFVSGVAPEMKEELRKLLEAKAREAVHEMSERLRTDSLLALLDAFGTEIVSQAGAKAAGRLAAVCKALKLAVEKIWSYLWELYSRDKSGDIGDISMDYIAPFILRLEDPRARYRSALRDLSRSALTREELCTPIWNFGCKVSAGPAWTNYDPYFQGRQPRTVTFNHDGSTTWWPFSPLGEHGPTMMWRCHGEGEQCDVLHLSVPGWADYPLYFARRLVNGRFKMESNAAVLWLGEFSTREVTAAAPRTAKKRSRLAQRVVQSP
jgi:hypothetical protein